MQAGCRCFLSRPTVVASERTLLFRKFGGPTTIIKRFARDVDDFRSMILPQSAVDQLNRFFTVSATSAQLNQNVFSSVSSQVSVEVMTMERSLVRQVVDLFSNRLTENTRNLLANCDSGLCEQPGIFQQISNSPSKSQFTSEKAIRFDFDGDTLIAFATSTSEFQLQNVRQEYQIRKCKRILFVFKNCRTETRHREFPREFSDAMRHEWEAFVNGKMILNFRLNNANLLV
uniref:Uncharacterized protein n=1 Tax=Plectus sambesii TaxID=2011161 RepID=A0A914XFA1_9BILA